MRVLNREVPLADGRVRYITTVMDDDDPEGMNWRREMFLRCLADNPRVLVCGALPFETMIIRHDGTRWVAELTAVGRRL